MFELMNEYATSKLSDLYQVLIYHKDNELYNRIFQQYGYPGYMVNFKSVSKFLFALAVGCMIDDGGIRDAYVPVAELLPEYASQMLNIPSEMVLSDRADGACRPQKWCSAAVCMVHSYGFR